MGLPRVNYGVDAPPVIAGFMAAGTLGTVFLFLTAFASAQLLGAGLGFFTFGWLTAAARLLRPGGHLAIIDFAKTRQYAADAQAAGLIDVTRSGPTPMMWPPVRVVTARKPQP